MIAQQIVNVKVYKVHQEFRWIVRSMYLLLVCISIWTLAQTYTYTAFDEHNHVDVRKKFEFYTWYLNIAFHVKSGSTIIRGVEPVTRDVTVTEIFKNVD